VINVPILVVTGAERKRLDVGIEGFDHIASVVADFLFGLCFHILPAHLFATCVAVLAVLGQVKSEPLVIHLGDRSWWRRGWCWCGLWLWFLHRLAEVGP